MKQNLTEIKRLQKLAGIINENEEEMASPNGLITFDELKKAIIKEYSEYSGQDVDELQELNMVKDIDSLINGLDEAGFNGFEVYDFIFQSINLDFEKILQACINNLYNDYDEDIMKELNSTTDIDELSGVLDYLGYNGDEAYDFIFDSILKK